MPLAIFALEDVSGVPKTTFEAAVIVPLPEKAPERATWPPVDWIVTPLGAAKPMRPVSAPMVTSPEALMIEEPPTSMEVEPAASVPRVTLPLEAWISTVAEVTKVFELYVISPRPVVASLRVASVRLRPAVVIEPPVVVMLSPRAVEAGTVMSLSPESVTTAVVELESVANDIVPTPV